MSHTPSAIIKRRDFLARLGGAGAVAALSPFVPLLEARGADNGIPRRLAIFVTFNGMTSAYPKPWAPVGGETNFTFPVGSILEPLSDVRDKLIVFQGIDMLSTRQSPALGGHPRANLNMLTATPSLPGTQFGGGGGQNGGWAGGPSIDQFVGQQVGGAYRFPSLVLGVNVSGAGATPFNRITFSAADNPVPPENSPYKVFDRVFGSGVSGITGDPLLLERLRSEQRSVLDVVKRDLDVIHGRLGTTGKTKLDAHLTALREVEKRLSAPLPKPGECTTPQLGNPINVDDENNMPVLGELQMKLASAALACGQTRVVLVQWGKGPSGVNFRWLTPKPTATWHELSHMPASDPSAQEQLIRIARWHTQQFHKFMDVLTGYPEGTGNLLDNTGLLWCTENSRSDNHDYRNMPYVLAGGMGGAFKTGRFLTYNNLPHNRLMTSLCHGMGLTQLSTFGHAQYGMGPLPGL